MEVTWIMSEIYYNDTSDLEKRKKVKELEIIQSQNKYYLKFKANDARDIIIRLGK